jgi:predicted metalloprotease
MKWRGRRQSTNIRDVRGSGGFGGLGGGFGGGLGRGPVVVRRAGGGGIGMIIVLVIIAWLFGINPLELLSGGPITTAPQQQQQRGAQSEVSDQMRDFVATVLADTEDTWTQIFARAGEDYPEPTLTLFSGGVNSACGFASAATGPFYCPADQNLYVDLGFYSELRDRFGAPGDFAQAYVLAHEVGHHVQNVLGTLRQTQGQGNEMSVRTELQADCYAGIWAHHTNQRGLLEEGDVQEALNAAAAVGDDAIQRRTQGYVVPESFNHGSSEQRAEWFNRGFSDGIIEACDTFSGDV